MGGAIFMTFLGIKDDMRKKGMGATNYWQFDGYDMEAFYMANRGAEVPTPMGCYITSATQKDPDTRGHHAPEGVESVEVMTILPGDAKIWQVDEENIRRWKYKRDETYKSLKQSIEDDMIRRLDDLFPGTKENIVYKESATPVTHSRYTRASAGTGYGLACTPEQFMHNRPGYRGPLPGLYFAGASTRAGHGIVGAMNSGFLGAMRVSLDLGKPIVPR